MSVHEQGSHRFPKLIQPMTPQLSQGQPGADAGQLWSVGKEGREESASPERCSTASPVVRYHPHWQNTPRIEHPQLSTDPVLGLSDASAQAQLVAHGTNLAVWRHRDHSREHQGIKPRASSTETSHEDLPAASLAFPFTFLKSQVVRTCSGLES